jgi:hypothetical protein
MFPPFGLVIVLAGDHRRLALRRTPDRLAASR